MKPHTMVKTAGIALFVITLGMLVIVCFPSLTNKTSTGSEMLIIIARIFSGTLIAIIALSVIIILAYIFSHWDIRITADKENKNGRS